MIIFRNIIENFKEGPIVLKYLPCLRRFTMFFICPLQQKIITYFLSFQVILFLSYLVTSSHTLTRNPPSSESFVKVKRGLEFGDVSYSYAHTDFSDRSGSNVKTTTVVRRIGSPKINDKIPQNMIKMPNGNTVQYWPADMDPNIQLKIKTPLKESLDQDHYGHYKSYSTNHDDVKQNWPKKGDEVKIVYKATESAPMVPNRVEKDIVSDMVGGQATSPILFPMDEANMKAMMRQKIVSIGTKLQSITPTKATLNTNVQGNQQTQYESQFKQKLPEIFVPPVGNYDEFLANCYKLSKEGSYAFSVPANDDLVKLASAVSAGDIMKIKELANNLKMPESAMSFFNSQRYTSQSNDNNANGNAINSNESSSQGEQVPTTTKRPAYVAPRVRLRKRINRRPKIPERMLSQQQMQRTQSRTTEVPAAVTEAEIVTETNTIANSTDTPQNRRRYYEYDY